MKKPSSWGEVILTGLCLLVVAYFVVRGQQRMQKEALYQALREGVQAGDNIVVYEPVKPGSQPSRNRLGTLTARNVKPSKARVAATEDEREALDLMREGNFQEAGKILDEMARQPEPWLVEMRKKLGVTNIYAPVGPSWQEIEGKERP